MRYYASRHKYPNKRRLFRLALLFGGLFVFLLALVGTILFYDRENDGAPTMQGQAWASLSPSEEYPQGALPAGLLFDKLLLEKSKHRLTAYAKGRPVRVYLVALGENPVGHKRFEGDKRTPEGNYTINDKNPNSAYYKNIGISYPNDDDVERAKKLNKSPGGDIKIHGLAPHFAYIGAAHRLADWTYGCIAVTNPEMEEIFSRTPVGTPIQIVP